MSDETDQLTPLPSTPPVVECERSQRSNPPPSKEEAVQSDPQGRNPSSSSSSTEEAGEPKPPIEDYTLSCPDYVSEAEVTAHIEAFKEAGVDARVAQKVVDKLVDHGRKIGEQFGASLEEERKLLQTKLGSDYETREKDIARYFRKEKIPDNDVQSLISAWGFEKTFNFFDRYAQQNKESSTGDTFVRSEGSQEADRDFDKVFDTPDFGSRVLSGDMEATKTLRQWAEKQATLNQ
ncbi:hypothetical protein FXW30_05315 [Candidatus Liberibacter asiaticus]|uniref:hypothetical protein n=1 Tax=Liberibacter asiaticus TaxID=34021 RepID=UPI0012F4ED4B|nr:hypothetical protein [Candidatus Liberibacter asiaticus]KAE9520207.1 hypothetical protein FXW30_05315 [Candidatus Liberibacter asiaticus]